MLPPRPALPCLTLYAFAAACSGSMVGRSTELAARGTPAKTAAVTPTSDRYDDLVQLFARWRVFETPDRVDGAPDYSAATMADKHAALKALQRQLQAIDWRGWPVPQQVDWHIVWAEMNGFDFNCRVLKPWARDPAFYKSVWTYQSDVPAHEGPTHRALVELWTYEFPLSAAAETKLAKELATIPPLLRQARVNLTGNAKELWVAGIRDLRRQVKDLDDLAAKLTPRTSEDLKRALEAARGATVSFADWLQDVAPTKTGPSGIGKDEYTWYLQKVHLVPLTWEDEVRLLQRELDRAWSSLRLEEQRNRDLPKMVAAADPAAYDALADGAASRLMAWLRDSGVMTVKPNMEPALREHLGRFVPEATRNFFWIGAHYDPTPLYTHFYHWWDLAQMRDEPHDSPIRRGALLYNIFDSRAEGTATGVEEMFMHAGLYDEHRRSREIVWILLAQRAARGLGSLYAHSNDMTMAEAGGVHVKYTPRGWMKTEPELLQFEQHLYLRQPGYGTSYITGKYLLERLLAEYTQMKEAKGEPFEMKDFFADFNAVGVIPMSLVRWQLTGNGDEVRRLVDGP